MKDANNLILYFSNCVFVKLKQNEPGKQKTSLVAILSFKARDSVLCIHSGEEIGLPKGFLSNYRSEEGNG